MGISSKTSMNNDMLDFNVIKFFCINTCSLSDKVFHPFLLDGSIGKFIGVLFMFLEVPTAMVAAFYGVIHAMEEAQKMRLTNVWLECDYALICVAFTVRTNVSWYNI